MNCYFWRSVIEYLKITENELLALIEVSESFSGSIGGGEDEGFAVEARNAEKAINSVLKRAGLKRELEHRYDVKI